MKRQPQNKQHLPPSPKQTNAINKLNEGIVFKGFVQCQVKFQYAEWGRELPVYILMQFH